MNLKILIHNLIVLLTVLKVACQDPAQNSVRKAPFSYMQIQKYIDEDYTQIQPHIHIRNFDPLDIPPGWELETFLEQKDIQELMADVFYLDYHQQEDLFQYTASKWTNNNTWFWKRAFIAAFTIGSCVDVNTITDDQDYKNRPTKSQFGDTLLQSAVHHQDIELAKILLAHGACPLLGKFQNYPIFSARKADLAKLLIEYGALETIAVTRKSKNIETLLKLCVNSNVESNTLELYLSRGLHYSLFRKNTIIFNMCEWITQHSQLEFLKKFLALHASAFFDSREFKASEKNMLEDNIKYQVNFTQQLILPGSASKVKVAKLADALITSLSNNSAHEHYEITADTLFYGPFSIPSNILEPSTANYLKTIIEAKAKDLQQPDSENEDIADALPAVSRATRLGKRKAENDLDVENFAKQHDK